MPGAVRASFWPAVLASDYTLGANGSLLAGSEGMEHVPAFTVQSVDSTGAGDAFIGSFATLLGEGLPEQEAVKRANLYLPPIGTKATQPTNCTGPE